MTGIGGGDGRPVHLEDMTVGERIRLARVEILKIDQRAFGKRLGVSQVTVHRWENDTKYTSDEHLAAIAGMIEQTPEWFRHGKSTPMTAMRLLLIVAALPEEKQEKFFEHMHFVLESYYLKHDGASATGDTRWKAPTKSSKPKSTASNGRTDTKRSTSKKQTVTSSES